MCGSASRRGDLEPQPAVVGHREQVVDGVQLAAAVGGVVDAADAEAQLERAARGRRAAGPPPSAGASRATWKVSSPRSTTTRSIASSNCRPAASRLRPSASATSSKYDAVGPRGGQPQAAGGLSARRSRRCRRCLGAEHAGPRDLLGQPLAACQRRLRPVGLGSWSAGVSSLTGVLRAARRPAGQPRGQRQPPCLACSSCSTWRSRCTPSFMFWILSCSLRIASISISGRGGQPGR